MRDEAGQANRMDDGIVADERGGRARRARRRVLLRIAVQLDDLRAREVRGGLLREPHHQHGADREVRRDEQAQPAFGCNVVQRLWIPAGRADNARDALLERGAHVRRRSVGRGEVDRGVEAGHVDRVAELEAAHLVTGVLEHRYERASDLPLGAEERELHQAAARATRFGFARRTAVWKRSSSGPTPAAERRSGASSTPAISASGSEQISTHASRFSARVPTYTPIMPVSVYCDAKL